MDRLDDLKKAIKNDKQLPDYIKELALDTLQKINYFTISLAKSTIGKITLAYFREHQYESDTDKENERLRKEKEWILDEMVNTYCTKSTRQSEKIRVIEKMQQALKEK